jgi:hypothetical protein
MTSMFECSFCIGSSVLEDLPSEVVHPEDGGCSPHLYPTLCCWPVHIFRSQIGVLFVKHHD